MKPEQPAQEYLSIRECSIKLNLSEKTIRRYVARGKFPSWQPGGEGARILIPASFLQDFSKSAPQKSPAENQPGSLPKDQKLSGPIPLWKRM